MLPSPHHPPPPSSRSVNRTAQLHQITAARSPRRTPPPPPPILYSARNKSLSVDYDHLNHVLKEDEAMEEEEGDDSLYKLPSCKSIHMAALKRPLHTAPVQDPPPIPSSPRPSLLSIREKTPMRVVEEDAEFIYEETTCHESGSRSMESSPVPLPPPSSPIPLCPSPPHSNPQSRFLFLLCRHLVQAPHLLFPHPLKAFKMNKKSILRYLLMAHNSHL